MSREIKIRFWEKGGDKWFWHCLEIDKERHCLEIDKETFAHGDEVWLNIDEIVAVERYTGLKDKNDKEIYEGDILSEHNGDITGEIIQQASGTWLIRWIGGSETDTTVLFEEHYLCDVIGNIHENPELLGGEE